MLSSNSFTSTQRLGERSVNDYLTGAPQNGLAQNNQTTQGSPSVFLAKVIVQQQQQTNLTTTTNTDQAEEQQVEAEKGEDLQENGYANLDAATAAATATNGTDIVISRDNGDDGDAPLLYVDCNDVISIEQDGDEKWFLAKSDQQVGRIPKSSCLILDDQISTGLCQYLMDNQYYHLNVCFASFVAQDVGDLSVTKGDIIVAIAPVNEHWMQGQVCYDSQASRWPRLSQGKQVGTFPLNHCWQLDSDRIRKFCALKIERDGPRQRSVKTSTSSSSTLSQQIPGWSFATTVATVTVAAAITQQQQQQQQQQQPTMNNVASEARKPFLSIAHSSSLSSGTSSLYSTENNNQTAGGNRHDIKRHLQQQQQHQQQQQNRYDFDSFHNGIDRSDSDRAQSVMPPPPPRPAQMPRQMSERQKSSSERAVSKPAGLLTARQQDKLKGWLHTVKKKTARLSTRITASLGLISLTRDEEFERHYESFKQLEKSIRVFIKNLTQFVEHFENFLVALQSTSDNLADFYRDKSSYQKELNEMRKKNKALNCEHFHAFKRTIDRQVITVASQLLQKFAGPHQLVHKRSAKLLDYDTKAKEMESCRDLNKRESLREEYSIAKDLYDRINGQLIEELPLFNQFALDIFRECILVLLESRRNLMLAYMQQTANLLDTPLMSSYTASDVASTILMSCELAPQQQRATAVAPRPPPPPSTAINSRFQLEGKQSGSDTRSASDQDLRGSEAGTTNFQPSGSGSSSGGGRAGYGMGGGGGGELSRPQSAMSQFSSEFEHMAMAAREISSTPLSQLSETNHQNMSAGGDDLSDDQAPHNVRFDEPDGRSCKLGSDGSSDSKHNENIESTIEATKSANRLSSTPVPHGAAANDNGNSKGARRRKSKHQIFVASWPFVATGPNQLSIACNQPLKLIKACDECGNPDWSLVKDKRNHLGYVPSSYIKPKD